MTENSGGAEAKDGETIKVEWRSQEDEIVLDTYHKFYIQSLCLEK